MVVSAGRDARRIESGAPGQNESFAESDYGATVGSDALWRAASEHPVRCVQTVPLRRAKQPTLAVDARLWNAGVLAWSRQRSVGNAGIAGESPKPSNAKGNDRANRFKRCEVHRLDYQVKRFSQWGRGHARRPDVRNDIDTIVPMSVGVSIGRQTQCPNGVIQDGGRAGRNVVEHEKNRGRTRWLPIEIDMRGVRK